MSTARAEIYWDRSLQAYNLRLGSIRGLDQIVTFLKANIPSSERSYDSATKVWTFTEKYLDGTIKLCQVIYGKQNVVVLSKDQVESSSQARSSSNLNVKTLDSLSNDMVEFMRLIPYEAAQSAYRKAAIVLHPDKGGDMERMSKLNAAWSRLEKELYKQ